MRILGESGRVDVSRAWIGRAGVDVGGFVGLSTMLNNISKDGNMRVTGSWSTLHWVDFYIGGGAT